MNRESKAFAPASVGNIGVGFDVMGHTIDGPGDIATVRRIDEPTVRIASITGATTDLPYDPAQNTAGAALIAMRETLALSFGFEIELEKGIALGSGMGGSASSAVAALVAANNLLDRPMSREMLYPFALSGESVASGGRHGDNVGAQLVGGVVITSDTRLIRVPVPEAWHCVLVHPDAVLETRRAREVLRGKYDLHEIVEQSCNLAIFLAGCYRGDVALIREGLRDVIAEPRRAHLIPGFGDVKRAALMHGALGASISGGGPSVFAWFESRAKAVKASAPMREAFGLVGVQAEVFISPVNGTRAEVVQ
jgi:homoserine kinase